MHARQNSNGIGVIRGIGRWYRLEVPARAPEVLVHVGAFAGRERWSAFVSTDLQLNHVGRSQVSLNTDECNCALKLRLIVGAEVEQGNGVLAP